MASCQRRAENFRAGSLTPICIIGARSSPIHGTRRRGSERPVTVQPEITALSRSSWWDIISRLGRQAGEGVYAEHMVMSLVEAKQSEKRGYIRVITLQPYNITATGTVLALSTM